ncbi:unnamed protein product [Ambrosiozyma monospora]|uniref:Unnamed protein product n=1 Tax=Ambrosiozyma monospora TaxID=43982 RepID=A0ACB5U989_AMBMO|nr:unnamed protein product [Ambrosiozyma monospora]
MSAGSQQSLPIQLVFAAKVDIDTIYEVGSTESFSGNPGHFLVIKYSGISCVLRFKAQEPLAQWETTIKRHLASESTPHTPLQRLQGQLPPANQQPVISPPQLISHQHFNDEIMKQMGASFNGSLSSNNSSESSLYHMPKMRTSNPNGSLASPLNNMTSYQPQYNDQMKIRSASTPLSGYDTPSARSNSQGSIPNFHGLMSSSTNGLSNGEMSALSSTLSSLTMNSNVNTNGMMNGGGGGHAHHPSHYMSNSFSSSANKVNMKLIHPELTVHLSVTGDIPYAELIVLLRT